MSKQQQMNDDIDWPMGFERTPARERTRNNRFEKSLRQSIDDLADELERVGVDDWRLDTGARHQKRNPRYPYADANPEDPGAVVRWSMDGEQYAVACDAYSRLRDNIRSMYLYIREKRKMEDRPVETGESEFANARLPSGDEDSIVAERPAHVVLGVEKDATEAEVIEAYRARVKETHPDQDGSQAALQEVRDAKEAMLNE